MQQEKERYMLSAEIKITFKQKTGMTAIKYAIHKNIDWRSLLNVLNLRYGNFKYGHRVIKVIEALKEDGIWDEKFLKQIDKDEKFLKQNEKNKKEFGILGVSIKEYAQKNNFNYEALRRILAGTIKINTKSQYKYIFDQLEYDGVALA